MSCTWIAKAWFKATRPGTTYARGQGVPLSYKEALAWFLKAADQGNADAQSNPGFMYVNGQGVPGKYKKALVDVRELHLQNTPFELQFNLLLCLASRSYQLDYARPASPAESLGNKPVPPPELLSLSQPRPNRRRKGGGSGGPVLPNSEAQGFLIEELSSLNLESPHFFCPLALFFSIFQHPVLCYFEISELITPI